VGRVSVANLRLRTLGGARRCADGPASGVSGRPAVTHPECEHDQDPARRLGGGIRCQLEPPGGHRVDRDLVTVQVQHQELAQALNPQDPLADHALELRRHTPDHEWIGRARGCEHPPTERGVEGIGGNVEIGKLVHESRLYPWNPRARLSRPSGHGHLKKCFRTVAAKERIRGNVLHGLPHDGLTVSERDSRTVRDS